MRHIRLILKQWGSLFVVHGAESGPGRRRRRRRRAGDPFDAGDVVPSARAVPELVPFGEDRDETVGGRARAVLSPSGPCAAPRCGAAQHEQARIGQ